MTFRKAAFFVICSFLCINACLITAGEKTPTQQRRPKRKCESPVEASLRNEIASLSKKLAIAEKAKQKAETALQKKDTRIEKLVAQYTMHSKMALKTDQDIAKLQTDNWRLRVDHNESIVWLEAAYSTMDPNKSPAKEVLPFIAKLKGHVAKLNTPE